MDNKNRRTAKSQKYDNTTFALLAVNDYAIHRKRDAGNIVNWGILPKLDSKLAQELIKELANREIIPEVFKNKKSGFK